MDNRLTWLELPDIPIEYCGKTVETLQEEFMRERFPELWKYWRALDE